MSDTERTDAPGEVPDKAEILERIKRSRAELDAVIAGADEERLLVSGADGWTVKDQLAHIAAWERSLEALLAGRPRYAALGVDRETWDRGDVDEVNHLIYAASRDRSPAEVVGEFRAAHEAVLVEIERLPAEDLAKHYSHFQPDDPPFDSTPVLTRVAGNTWEHYDEHLDTIRALLG